MANVTLNNEVSVESFEATNTKMTTEEILSQLEVLFARSEELLVAAEAEKNFPSGGSQVH